MKINLTQDQVYWLKNHLKQIFADCQWAYETHSDRYMQVTGILQEMEIAAKAENDPVQVEETKNPV